MAELAYSKLNGFSWFGLVVYFSVMGFVIRGVRIPLPLLLGRLLIRLFVLLRLRDPSPVPPPSPSIAPADATRADQLSRTLSKASEAGTLRSRSESRVGMAGALPKEVERGEEDARLAVVLDLRTAPAVGVVLLLVTKTIDGAVLRQGIVGEEGVRPYDVLVLFISLAYISTALDSTGGLRALAFWIAQKAARRPKHAPPSADKTASGPRLYLLLYGFWAFFGSLVGNDPIILSGTAFLCYFTRVTGITDPTAWIYSQFIAANAASAILVTSNPTNVLIAGAFELNFLTGYTKYTLLPSLIAMLLAAPLTFYTFTFLKPASRTFDSNHPVQAYIPAQLLPPGVDPRSALLDPAGAIFHTSLMAVTLVLLIGTSFVPGGKVEVWMVTAPAGILAFGRDIWSERNLRPAQARRATLADASQTEEFELQEATTSSSPSLRTPSPRLTLPSLLRSLTHRFPTTASTLSRLPLSLLLFAGGTFILSRALTTLGWTSLFATSLASLCTSPARTIFLLGYLITLLLCPFCGTNIGATIVVVQVLLDPKFSQAPHVVADPRILRGAIFSTALASNLGACSWTFSSSLAGLLWVSILRQKGVPVRAREFAKWNCLFLPVLSTVASAVVLLECYCF